MSKIYLICLCLFVTACVSPAFRPIQGKDPETVRAIKGEPSSILREQNYEMWTYRRSGCTEVVFFDNKGQAASWYEMGICEPEE